MKNALGDLVHGFIIVLMGLLVYSVGMFSGIQNTTERMQKDAVIAGVARWTKDDSGLEKFKYITHNEEKNNDKKESNQKNP